VHCECDDACALLPPAAEAGQPATQEATSVVQTGAPVIQTGATGT
jgi:hypothetical protein